MDIDCLQRSARPYLIALPVIGLLAGTVIRFGVDADWAPIVWGVAALPVLAALLLEIVLRLGRGDLGLDVIAALSITSALVFGEQLAALVVALMYAGGQYLEDFAQRRATREMTALLARAPRTALRRSGNSLEEVPIEAVLVGDRLSLRRGDVTPVDGVVCDGTALLDQSALTGEWLPVKRRVGEDVLSGSVNVGELFEFTVTRRATESTYAGIVRLVEQARNQKAPMSRLADRYAVAFLIATIALALAAALASGDPVRAVAVLVVATPCPLILAVPVALVAGVSTAARQGILVKGAKALERMGSIRALVVDKTGTITTGLPTLVAIEAQCPDDELLRLAASLDQASTHSLAKTITAEAARRKIPLSLPEQVTEAPGDGIEGLVDGQHVRLGGSRYVAEQVGPLPNLKTASPGAMTVAVAVDGAFAGFLVFSDLLRPGGESLLGQFRNIGINHITLATGDGADVAETLASGMGFDEILSEMRPEEKVRAVISARKHGPVMMIGDGVNDAPALAAADIGVAMGTSGATATAEAADVVLLVDKLERIVRAIHIARRCRSIAIQSVVAGIGLSLAGMVVAALGYLQPVEGALLQEAIDVAVILNAMRALRLKDSMPDSPNKPSAARPV